MRRAIRDHWKRPTARCGGGGAIGMTTVADVLAIGLDHHRDGRLDSAEHAYRAVLTFDAGQIDAVRLMGSLLYEQNRHEEAAALLGQSVTAGAINAEICRIWACALAAVGLGGEVVAAGWRVLALDPTDAHTGHLVAHFLRESGRSELARAMLTQAILLQPDLAVAHHDIGVIDRVAGQYRLAAESFQRAVGHDPGLDSGWYNLGCTKLQLGDVDAGIAALRRVVEAETASAALTASALVEIGKAQFGNGDVAAALASYRLAIDRDANN
ncbi:MAG: tetratricopeptide repeat protein, partial [Alphaproteobacteria bacterium]|nr:tetratricopeptide repeat protein [Alphaproteobacteria bacterium]